LRKIWGKRMGGEGLSARGKNEERVSEKKRARTSRKQKYRKPKKSMFLAGKERNRKKGFCDSIKKMVKKTARVFFQKTKKNSMQR